MAQGGAFIAKNHELHIIVINVEFIYTSINITVAGFNSVVD
jgi:hypothetical protein